MRRVDRNEKESAKDSDKRRAEKHVSTAPPQMNRRSSTPATKSRESHGIPLRRQSQSTSTPTSGGAREALAALYKEPSQDVNSHDMAEFFLAPYKDDVKKNAMDVLNPMSAATHAAKMLHARHAHAVVARVDLVKRLSEKKRSEVLRFVDCMQRWLQRP